MTPQAISTTVQVVLILGALSWAAKFAWAEYKLHLRNKESEAEWADIHAAMDAAIASKDQAKIDDAIQWFALKCVAGPYDVVRRNR